MFTAGAVCRSVYKPVHIGGVVEGAADSGSLADTQREAESF